MCVLVLRLYVCVRAWTLAGVCDGGQVHERGPRMVGTIFGCTQILACTRPISDAGPNQFGSHHAECDTNDTTRIL